MNENGSAQKILTFDKWSKGIVMLVNYWKLKTH